VGGRVLLLAGLPSFIAETKFSGDAFRLFRWRSPETRMQMYLETVLAREDHAKEVKLFELGRCCSSATRDLRKLYREDRASRSGADAGASRSACSAPRVLRRLRVDRESRRARPITLGR
jgi:hypothetical protein